MGNWKEYRQPWYLLISKSKHPQEVIPFKSRGNLISFEPHEYDKHYYTLQEIDSDLLIAIDNDDVASVKKALEKDKIDINTPYMIPDWEIPDAVPPQLQTFLHRAIWDRSENVFKFLLDNGANPRIKGHCDSTVIDNTFSEYHLKPKEVLKFGMMLVDAGMTTAEIKEKGKNSTKEYKPVVAKLIHSANFKAKFIRKKKNKSSFRNTGKVRD